jgi:hypothetical protein
MRYPFLTTALLIASTTVLAAQSATARPKITGISHLAVYTSNPAATEHYYTVTVGAVKMADPESQLGVKYALSGTQYVEV